MELKGQNGGGGGGGGSGAIILDGIERIFLLFACITFAHLDNP